MTSRPPASWSSQRAVFLATSGQAGWPPGRASCWPKAPWTCCGWPMPTRRWPSGACSACFATPRSPTCRVCFETANTTWSPPMAATAGRPRRGVCRFSTSSCCTCAPWTATGSAALSLRLRVRRLVARAPRRRRRLGRLQVHLGIGRGRQPATRPDRHRRRRHRRPRTTSRATGDHRPRRGCTGLLCHGAGTFWRHTPLARHRGHVSRSHPTALRRSGRALPRLGHRRRARRGRRRAVLGDRSAALLRAVADAAADRRATGRSRDSAALLPAVDAVAVVDHHTRRVGGRGWPLPGNRRACVRDHRPRLSGDDASRAGQSVAADAGVRPEFWPTDWRTYDGSDAYGWGRRPPTF